MKDRFKTFNTTKPTELEVLIHQAKMFGKSPGLIPLSENQYKRRMNKENFIGKKISFEDEHGENFKGVCESIGPNSFFASWGTVVILDDRTPVTNVLTNTIKIIE